MNDSLYLQELEQLFNQKWQELKKEQQEEDNKTNKMGEGEKIVMPISELENQIIEPKQPVVEQSKPEDEQTVSKDKTQKDEQEEIGNEESSENTE